MNTTLMNSNERGVSKSLQCTLEDNEVNKNAMNYNEVYRDLAEILPDSMVQKVWKHFRGQCVSFPQSLYSPEYIHSFIIENAGTMKTSEIAKKFNLTDRRVRQIISDHRKKQEGKG